MTSAGRVPPLYARLAFGGEPYTMDVDHYISIRGIGESMKLSRGLWMLENPERMTEPPPWATEARYRERRRAKRREKMASHKQLSGQHCNAQEWHEGREAIDVLRELGYGWTQVSQAADVDERGWAANAYTAKHMMHPAHVRALKAEIHKLPAEDVARALEAVRARDGGNVGEERSGEAAERLAEMVAIKDEVMGAFGFNAEDTATLVFGYAGPGSMYSTLRGSDPGEDRLRAARGRLQNIRDGICPGCAVSWGEAHEGRCRWDGVVWAHEDSIEDAEADTPAPPAKPAPAPAPSGFGWMDDVQETLLSLAARVEAEAGGVPEMFRGPYRAAAEKITNLAAEFSR